MMKVNRPLTLPRDPGPVVKVTSGAVLCYPTFCHEGPELSVFSQHGGLVSPSEFARIIGGIFPIALCGCSSL